MLIYQSWGSQAYASFLEYGHGGFFGSLTSQYTTVLAYRVYFDFMVYNANTE
jgi:hypothetical protein